MKINIEYELDDMTYVQLKSMAMYLKSTNQNENLKSVNIRLRILESRIGRSSSRYELPEIKKRKTFWQRLFNR